MKKEEILEKVSNKKAVIGEMEKEKLSKSALISLLATGILAVAFIIVECILNHPTSAYIIASICFFWAGLFYALQYFLAKRPWQVLIGSVLDGLAFTFFLVRYILFVCGIWCWYARDNL